MSPCHKQIIGGLKFLITAETLAGGEQLTINYHSSGLKILDCLFLFHTKQKPRLISFPPPPPLEAGAGAGAGFQAPVSTLHLVLSADVRVDFCRCGAVTSMAGPGQQCIRQSALVEAITSLPRSSHNHRLELGLGEMTEGSIIPDGNVTKDAARR